MLLITGKHFDCKISLFPLQQINYYPTITAPIIFTTLTTIVDDVLLLLAYSVTVAYILDIT